MSAILDIALPYQKSFILAPQKKKIWTAARQCGKSWALAALLTLRALEKRGGLSLCISTGARAASEIVRKCAMFGEAVEALTHGQVMCQPSFDKVVFSNGSRVLSLPSSADGSALRGWTARCVCIDEAAFIPHLDGILQAVAPSLTRDPDAELVLASTPAGRNGTFYDLWCRASEDPAWHVQSTTVHDAIHFGLRIDLASLHELCPDPMVFAQEYECCWAASSSQLFDLDLLQPWEDDIDPSQGQHFNGADWARTGDSSAFASIMRLGDGRIVLERGEMLKNMNFQAQIERFQAFFQATNAKKMHSDSTGLGSPVTEQLASKLGSSRVAGVVFTAQSKARMFEYLVKIALSKKLFIHKDLMKQVREEVQLVQRIVSDDGSVHYTAARRDGSHADLITALCLALDAERASTPSFSMPESWARQSSFSGFSRRI